MPDTCSFEQASLVEPLSVALHASRRAPIKAGGSVLVFGAGSMGILQCAVAKALGAAQIVVVDVDVHRVTFACNEAFATSGHVLPRKPHNITPEDSLKSAKETAHQLLKMFRPGTDGFDVVFECTGVESCIETAIFVSRLIFFA
jgi:L-iditol 2-dehydrogenase